MLSSNNEQYSTVFQISQLWWIVSHHNLIKLHKPGYPIRPVVSYVTAPRVEIFRILINIIQVTCNFNAQCNVKNSYELGVKVREIYLAKNTKFISFHLKNLFPGIPADAVLFVSKLLDKNQVITVIMSEISLNSTTKFTHQIRAS